MQIGVISFGGESNTNIFYRYESLFLKGTFDPYGELGEHLSQLGITLSEDTECEVLIDFSQNFAALRRTDISNKASKKIYVCLEPSVVQASHYKKAIKKLTHIYDYVLSAYGVHVDNKTVFKINMPYCFDFAYTPICKYQDKKLITIVSGNKSSVYPNELYSKRKEAIRYFETRHPDEFDMYGQRWSKAEYPSYKGAIKDKLEVYQQYKFAICFENSICQDGITEKIFDCFQCRCVPVYLGSVNVSDYIPEGCFIDYRQFANMEEMYQFLVQMPEEQYNKYIENIEAYLESPQKDVFSPEHFAEQIYKVVQLPKRHTNGVCQWLRVKCFLIYDKVKLYDASYIPSFCVRIRDKLKNLLKG